MRQEQNFQRLRNERRQNGSSHIPNHFGRSLVILENDVAGTRLVFTRHAQEMLIERRIERAWVELTIREPEAVEPDTTRRNARIPAHSRAR